MIEITLEEPDPKYRECRKFQIDVPIRKVKFRDHFMCSRAYELVLELMSLFLQEKLNNAQLEVPDRTASKQTLSDSRNEEKETVTVEGATAAKDMKGLVVLM